MQKPTRLHLLVGTTLTILVIGILGLIVYNNWIGISVNLQTNNPRDQIGPYEIITLTFSQAVRPGDIEKQLQIQPAIDVRLEWQNDRTLRVTSPKAYPGTLTIHLPPGEFGVNGDAMRLDALWTLTVRQPAIVYINYAEPKDELMAMPVTGGSARQLTSTRGKVLDLNVSPSGETIVYSVANKQNGSDLWLIDRNGQNPRILLGCELDSCHSPTWSPDGKTIAYNRQQPGATEEDPRVRLWVINPETSDNHPVFFDPQMVGTDVLWSPDGNWLATYDSKNIKTHLTHLTSHQEILLPNYSEQLGSWSPDSKTLIYPNYTLDEKGTLLKNSLFLVDIKTGSTSTFQSSASDDNNYRYGNPLWAPDGNLIVLSMRNIRHEIPRLWVVQADKPDAPLMTAAAGYSYDFYQWDMQGTNLLVQQTSLTRAYLYEIAIWNSSSGYRVVGKNGLNPHWLP